MEPEPQSPPGLRRSTRWIVAALMLMQASLIAAAIPRNAVTVDEYQHLPVGLRYWDTGEFWSYHHNPPLTRLVAAAALVVAGMPRHHVDYDWRPGTRALDAAIARHFEALYGRRIMRPFVIARGMGIVIALLGGFVVFSWSRELWGDGGGILSLALWTFSPWVLAHAGLVTPDVGATVLMTSATYAFWRYLRAPSATGAVWSGLLLGLAQGAKFTAVWLVPVWIVLAALRFARRAGAGGSVVTGGTEPRPSVWRGIVHAALVMAASLAVLNALYLWEGTGNRLGSFELRSPTLTRISSAAALTEFNEPARVNRFRGTWLGAWPMPLPEHYVLGFDDQLWDLEARGFSKYLRGQLRGPDEDGWWYYYLYGLAVKTPLGTLVILALSALLMLRRECRRDKLAELTLLLPVAAVIIPLSIKTGLNGHVRYVLPVLPLLHIFAGRAAVWAAGDRWRVAFITATVLAGTTLSVVRAHPHYLTYFNEFAGGPRGGIRHLADSNLDWGQGLIPLRDWLDDNAPGETVQLAYFGTLDPANLGIDYELLNAEQPHPGLCAVSATLLVGLPRFPGHEHGHVFRLYGELQPIAVPGDSIYVYRLTDAEASWIALRAGR